MGIAARDADFSMLEWICARTRDVHSALEGAIEAGNVELLQWLLGETLGGDGVAQHALERHERSTMVVLANKSRAWAIHKWLLYYLRRKSLGIDKS